MSWLSKQLKSAKKMVTHPKEWAGNALQTGVQVAPYAAAAMAIPGLGAGLGKAASAIGLGGVKRVLSGGGGNIKVPKELDMGSIFPGLPGMPSPTPTFPSGGGGGFDWDNAIQTLTGGNKSGGGFDIMSLINGVKNNAVDIGIGGLAGYQALNSANASKRAGKLQDKAIGGAEKRWSDNEALRTEGRRRLLNPTRPDLSSVYVDPTNPFARRRTPAVAMPSPTPSVPVGAVPLGGQREAPVKPMDITPSIPLVEPLPHYVYPQGVPKGIPQKRLLPAPY